MPRQEDRDPPNPHRVFPPRRDSLSLDLSTLQPSTQDDKEVDIAEVSFGKAVVFGAPWKTIGGMDGAQDSDLEAQIRPKSVQL